MSCGAVSLFLCMVVMYFWFMIMQSWQGGLFVRPLRGFMIQTAEIYPQVSAGVEQETCHLVQTARPSMPEEEGLPAPDVLFALVTAPGDCLGLFI